MNTTLIIPIHSFVDLITNSSSEIFVAADENTVKAIKKLVDNIITASASSEVVITADDLFTFEIVTLCYNEKYAEVYLNESDLRKKKKEIEEIIDNEDGKYTAEQVEAAETWEFKDDDEGYYPKTSVRVEVKNKDNKSAVAAAKILSDLTGLFSIEASYG